MNIGLGILAVVEQHPHTLLGFGIMVGIVIAFVAFCYWGNGPKIQSLGPAPYPQSRD